MKTPSARSEKKVLLSVPHMGGAEARYVQEAFDSNWLSTVGPNIDEVERIFRDILGVPVVALSSGTAGLHLALRLAGVGHGDEVVAQTLTFVASVNPVVQLGAKPVLMDSDRASWNLDPQRLAEFLDARARVNRLPKAVVVVHLFGQPARLDEIARVCRQHGVALVEDAAESLGSRYRGRHPGTFGDVGIFSFNGNKMITGTCGGLLASPRPGWVEKARHWSTQARDPDPVGVNNYVHSEAGYNYRMSNVVAGIVRGQAEVLGDRVDARRAVFGRYQEGLSGIPGIEPQPELLEAMPGDGATGTLHSRWLSTFLIDARAFGMGAHDLIRWLAMANVESRPVWRPMHLQPLFRDCERVGGEVAEDLNARGICLPSSSSLPEEDQAFVIESIRAAHEAARQVV